MANRTEHQRSFESPNSSHRGIMRQVRSNKRTEAEERNNKSVSDRRRAYWKERGFVRQSHAAQLVRDTVLDINEQAKIHKQRSADWPMVKDDLDLHA